MNISQFIDNVVAGNAAAARENLNDLLSAKAFESIDGQKKELATNLFGGNSEENGVDVQETEDEVTDDEEAYAESVEHDGEQLDELSKATVRGYLKGVKRENDPRIHGDSAGPANQMSDKARSLGRTEQDKEDSRYQGKKTAIAKLGGSKSVLASKVPAK